MGHAFRDPALLRQALTHPSVGHEQGSSEQHNQRLEFLGDAVLQLVLSAELYQRYPESNEGPLTKARARLVNRDALAALSRSLGLREHIILSRGEESNGGRDRPSILADALEALLGALLLDGGYDEARRVILKLMGDHLVELEAPPSMDNPKGELQEILQAISAEHPAYEIVAISGPDHDREFECAVYYRGGEIGRGKGKSKKAAESEAAAAALDRWRNGTRSDALENPA